jgi:hypothetical protein
MSHLFGLANSIPLPMIYPAILTTLPAIVALIFIVLLTVHGRVTYFLPSVIAQQIKEYTGTQIVSSDF